MHIGISRNMDGNCTLGVCLRVCVCEYICIYIIYIHIFLYTHGQEHASVSNTLHAAAAKSYEQIRTERVVIFVAAIIMRAMPAMIFTALIKRNIRLGLLGEGPFSHLGVSEN